MHRCHWLPVINVTFDKYKSAFVLVIPQRGVEIVFLRTRQEGRKMFARSVGGAPVGRLLLLGPADRHEAEPARQEAAFRAA